MHVLAYKITETAKSLKVCYLFNINCIYFKIVRQQTEMMYQQRVSCSGSCVIERAVGKWRQCPSLAFMLEEDILSTCCNTDDVL